MDTGEDSSPSVRGWGTKVRTGSGQQKEATVIKKLHHVALAVKDIQAAVDDYTKLFDLPKPQIQEVKSQNVKGALLVIGDAEIELIEPTDPQGGVAKFLERKGESLHHICFQVENIDQALQKLEAGGAQLIDKKSRPGLAGMVGFVHPKSTGGVLVELCTPVARH